MSIVKVRAAMMSGYATANLGLVSAHENVKFTQPVNSLWAEVFYMPGVPTMASLGAEGEDDLQGYLQVNINAPLGKGSGAAMAKAEQLRAFFYGGRTFIYQGQPVTIKTTGTKAGIPTDSCYKVPTVINFYARIPRVVVTDPAVTDWLSYLEEENADSFVRLAEVVNTYLELHLNSFTAPN